MHSRGELHAMQSVDDIPPMADDIRLRRWYATQSVDDIPPAADDIQPAVDDIYLLCK